MRDIDGNYWRPSHTLSGPINVNVEYFIPNLIATKYSRRHRYFDRKVKNRLEASRKNKGFVIKSLVNFNINGSPVNFCAGSLLTTCTTCLTVCSSFFINTMQNLQRKNLI